MLHGKIVEADCSCCLKYAQYAVQVCILFASSPKLPEVGLGTALHAGRSRVRFQMVEFFIDIILPKLRPGVGSASNRNEYREYFLGVKAAGA